jgi:ligand-binding sensor domain-containing protein
MRARAALIGLGCSLGVWAELLPILSYSSADGLAANQIDHIVVDSRGLIWFCTPQGLSRFDGHRFVTFGVDDGLPSLSVRSLLETRAGEYYVTTARELCEFRKGAGRRQFAVYTPRK